MTITERSTVRVVTELPKSDHKKAKAAANEAEQSLKAWVAALVHKEVTGSVR